MWHLKLVIINGTLTIKTLFHTNQFVCMLAHTADIVALQVLYFGTNL